MFAFLASQPGEPFDCSSYLLLHFDATYAFVRVPGVICAAFSFKAKRSCIPISTGDPHRVLLAYSLLPNTVETEGDGNPIVETVIGDEKQRIKVNQFASLSEYPFPVSIVFAHHVSTMLPTGLYADWWQHV